MDTIRAERLFRHAYKYCESKLLLAERESLSPATFAAMKCETFLYNYFHVVYAAGFRLETLYKLEDRLKVAYHNFDLAKISQMNNYDEVLAIFNNRRKASSFVSGAKTIASIGYDEFKKRVLNDWHYLGSLNGIGAITVHHLAMDLGFDTLKPDLHLQRVSDLLGARDPFELADYLSSTFNKKKMVVDAAIFEFCERKAFKAFGCATIQDFVQQKC